MYSRLPPLNGIRVFDAVARLGSFKRAAEELHVTPTAVSHQIKALEASLGVLLFLRKTRAIQLTQDGKVLAETVYSVLQQLTNTISEISNTKNIITVSTTSSFAAMWLVPNLGKFNQLYPDVDVVVQTSEHVDNLEKDRKIDLAIRYGVYNESLKNSTLLITEDIGVYATPNYIESITTLEEANLLETKWQNENLSEISWHTLLIENGKNNLEYNIRQFTQEHHIIQAALAGQGFALVSSFLVQNAVAQGWLVKYNVTEKSNKANGFCYYLVIPEHNRQSKIIMAFKDWIVSELVIE